MSRALSSQDPENKLGCEALLSDTVRSQCRRAVGVRSRECMHASMRKGDRGRGVGPKVDV